MDYSKELKEIENEVEKIIDEEGIDGLKEFMITTIMSSVEDDLNSGIDDDYTRMLRVAKDNDLWNPDVLSLVMVATLPISIETATMAMRGIVVKKDGSPVDLSEDQIKFVRIMEATNKQLFS